MCAAHTFLGVWALSRVWLICLGNIFKESQVSQPLPIAIRCSVRGGLLPTFSLPAEILSGLRLILMCSSIQYEANRYLRCIIGKKVLKILNSNVALEPTGKHPGLRLNSNLD